MSQPSTELFDDVRRIGIFCGFTKLEYGFGVPQKLRLMMDDLKTIYTQIDELSETMQTLKDKKEGQASFPFPWRLDRDWVMYQKGLVYLQLNKNQEAVENFEMVCKMEPPSNLKLVALSHMGLAQSKMGDFEAAFNNIQAAIEIDDNDPQPYYFKAMVLMELESQDMASELLKQAKELFAKLEGEGADIPSVFPANEE